MADEDILNKQDAQFFYGNVCYMWKLDSLLNQMMVTVPKKERIRTLITWIFPIQTVRPYSSLFSAVTTAVLSCILKLRFSNQFFSFIA